MSRKTVSYPYFVLGVFLFCWISLPRTTSDSLRSFAVASFSPIWKGWGRLFQDRRSADSGKEIARLQWENQNLRARIESAQDWIHFEAQIGDQLEVLKAVPKNEFFKRRAAQLRGKLESQLLSFPAEVIYRDPSSWSSSLWVYAGEEDNRALGRKVISKNSPVVSGCALVGVVDYVGEKQSRVRLITDSGLSPAVRAVRGGMQNRELGLILNGLLSRLEAREDLFASSEERQALLTRLDGLKMKLDPALEESYLAKGELHGSSAPFWRSRGLVLSGVGFNYDYADEEGPARDLRTGRPVGSSLPAQPILKEGDLLVTSGLDGVFPAGLLTGTVSRIAPLKEGSYAYEIEVRPAAYCLNDLRTLFILPSLSAD